MQRLVNEIEITTGYNSTYSKGGVSCSNDSFVVNQTLVFHIKFCSKSPAFRVAAKRFQQCRRPLNPIVCKVICELLTNRLPLDFAKDFEC